MAKGQIPAKYKKCARDQHLWYPGTDPDWIPPFGMAGQVDICDNCVGVRYRAIDSLGKSFLRYDWPAGYSMKRDERPTKRELRAELWIEESRAGRVPKKKLRSVS